MVHSLEHFDSDFPMVSGRLPLIGHLPQIHRDALKLLRNSAQRHGPVFRLDYGFGIHPIILHGDDAFKLLRNKEIDSSPIEELAPLVTGGALNTMDGEPHKRARDAINPPFSRKGLELANIGATINEVVLRHIGTWGKRSKLIVAEETRKIALEILFRIIGVDATALSQWASKYHDFALGIINLPIEFPGSPSWRSRRAVEWMNSRLLKMIVERRRLGDRRTFLGAIVHGSTEGEDGEPLGDRELLGNLRLIGFAGHETSASVMTWMMLKISSDDSLWTRLCDEAATDYDIPMLPTDLYNFPFAEALFRETARFYPPPWFLPRRAKESFTYGGKTIPSGALVGIPIITLSRSFERYSDPDCFNPDRWLSGERRKSPIETCQFGGGPHFCLGYRLALLEGVQFIISVVRMLSSLGLRPRLRKALPEPRYLPVAHASSSTIFLGK